MECTARKKLEEKIVAFFFYFKMIIIIMCMDALPERLSNMCIQYLGRQEEGVRSHLQLHLQFHGTMWVLGTGPGSEVSALND